jgi:hypothetical protein
MQQTNVFVAELAEPAGHARGNCPSTDRLSLFDVGQVISELKRTVYKPKMAVLVSSSSSSSGSGSSRSSGSTGGAPAAAATLCGQISGSTHGSSSSSKGEVTAEALRHVAFAHDSLLHKPRGASHTAACRVASCLPLPACQQPFSCAMQCSPWWPLTLTHGPPPGNLVPAAAAARCCVRRARSTTASTAGC